MKRVLPFVLILICCISMPAFTQYSCKNSVLTKEFIYTPQDVQFPSCHASTIIQIKNGLIAAWFGGTAERNPDVGIWISIQSSGKWSKPVEVANGIQHKSKRYPCWNPVLYNTGDKILLYYKVGPSPSEWWGEMITSDDNGKSWSRTYRLPEDIYGPVKNKPILLKNGDLLCPSSTEDHGWRLHMEFTPDFGRTWERTAALNGKDTAAIQPSILTNNDGTLQLVCRSKSSAILTALSNDNGRTWTKLIPTGLPNPNSGIDAVTLNDGRHLIVYNHIKKGRNILNVSVSKDCKTWEAAVILENEASDDEFSYPAVIQDEEGLVHITYTWKRELIRHVVIDPARIITKPIVDGNWPE